MLRHQQIIWKTDNSALQHLEIKWYFADRLKRWLLYMNMYHVDIQHIPGEQNVVADALSRSFATGIEFRQLVNYIDEQGRKIDLQMIISEQQKDQDIIRGLQNSKYRQIDDVICTNRGKIAVPTSLVTTFVQIFHVFYGHVGSTKCTLQLQLRFYWPKMEQEVAKEILNCRLCTESKICSPNLDEKAASLKPTRPFEIVATDLYGPLPMTKYQLRYILVFRDLYTRYTKLYTISHATANCFREKLSQYVKQIPFKIHRLLSDNAKQYVSKIWQEVCKEYGIEVNYVAPYSQKSNPAERVMRDIGDSLRIMTSNNHKQWYKYVRDMEMNINNTVHTRSNVIPELCVNGKLSKWPFGENTLQVKPPDITELRRQIDEYFEKKKHREDEQNKAKEALRTLNIGDHVFISNHTLSNKAEGINAKLNPKFKGPFKVVKQLGDNRYRVQGIEDEDTVYEQHISNLIKRK